MASSSRYNRALFLQALQSALQGSSSVQRDPVKNIYYDDTTVFDHESVFAFLDDSAYNQGTINRDNIQSAATLYAIMVLGDEMGIYKAADVVLKYVTMGKIDVASSTTATRIYNYMKLRDDRLTYSERSSLYMMTFNIGEGQTIDGMGYNKNFQQLWETLMYEVTRYIRKYERAEVPDNVSKSSIIQIMLDLQNNLSRAASGMTKIFVPELYAYLEDAIQILDAQEIKDQIGHGVTRDIWNVVESISREEFGHYPNTSALRTVASNARRIMMMLSEFSPSTLNDDDFQRFVRDVEAYIVGKSQVENTMSHLDYKQDYEDDNYDDPRGMEEPEYETMEEDWDF